MTGNVMGPVDVPVIHDLVNVVENVVYDATDVVDNNHAHSLKTSY